MRIDNFCVLKMTRVLKYLVGTMVLLSSLLVAEAQNSLKERVEEHLKEVERYRHERLCEVQPGIYCLEYPDDDEFEIKNIDIIYLSEEEVLGWTEIEPDSLLDNYMGVGGFNWCGIYECMSRDSFACIPFDEELYFGRYSFYLSKVFRRKFENSRVLGNCDCPLDELVLVYYNSPEWTWPSLVGREGLLPVCRKHKLQFLLKVWKLS
ncbi:MAG: hypothetical protein MJZ24_02315 [Paludibacteraceae bacterium]|nr:hypothetical protein [Paludibacteraceae bacterium]